MLNRDAGDPEAVRAMLNSMLSKSDSRNQSKVQEQNKALNWALVGEPGFPDFHISRF